MINKEDTKKLSTLLTKLSNVFNDFYVFKNGYVISTNLENSAFVAQINLENDVKLFQDLVGDFKLLHVWDCKKLKKALTELLELNDNNSTEESEDSNISISEYVTAVVSETDIKSVTSLLDEKLNKFNEIDKWENFQLSDNEEENEKLILSLFKQNNYVNFTPKGDEETPQEVILTKAILPLVSEKNYTQLYYQCKKLDNNLYNLIFDFDFDYFRLFMFHNFVKMNDIDEEDND